MPAMFKTNERCYKRKCGLCGFEALNHRSELKIWDTFRSQIAELWFPYDHRGIWTIRPGRLAPESTNLIMFLLFVFYQVFYKRFNTICSCCLLLTNVFNFEVKAKERLVDSVNMQSEICERRWNVLLEQNDHM